MKELAENMQEALNLCIQEPEESKDLAPFPDESIKKTKYIVEVPLDPEVAFAFMVRYYRIKQGLTQHQAAKQMGFDTIYKLSKAGREKMQPDPKNSLKNQKKIIS